MDIPGLNPLARPSPPASVISTWPPSLTVQCPLPPLRPTLIPAGPPVASVLAYGTPTPASVSWLPVPLTTSVPLLP